MTPIACHILVLFWIVHSTILDFYLYKQTIYTYIWHWYFLYIFITLIESEYKIAVLTRPKIKTNCLYSIILIFMWLGGVTYRFSYWKRYNDVGRWGWGRGRRAVTNDIFKFREIVEFQSSWIVMDCQWIAYSYTKSA